MLVQKQNYYKFESKYANLACGNRFIKAGLLDVRAVFTLSGYKLNLKITMKKVIQIVLLLVAIFLGWYLYRQFASPMEFQKTKDHREAAVIQSLKDIRAAQRAYRQANQRFTPSFDTLANFILNDSLTYTRAVGSTDDSLAVAQGRVFRQDFKVAVKDTIFYGRGLNDQYFRELRYIPYGNGAEFMMDAGSLATASGVTVQVFEAKAPYKTYLSDEEYKQELINLIDERKTLNRYPGLKVGSMTETTNESGNWE